MAHHDLKLHDIHWPAVVEGRKTFEIRVDDRQYNVGDTVALRRWCRFKSEYLPGDPIQCQITYITDFAQQSGFVVFGFRKI